MSIPSASARNHRPGRRKPGSSFLAGLLLPLLLIAGCGGDGPSRFQRSCAGVVVANCRVPYGASRLLTATMTPPEIGLEDLDTPARVEVTLDTCDPELVPRPHRVTVAALVRPDDLPIDPLDAGVPNERLEVLGEVFDDGEGLDETARDGLLVGELATPVFDAERGIPASSEIRLVFQASIRNPMPSGPIGGEFTCQSETLDVPYRTGPLVSAR